MVTETTMTKTGNGKRRNKDEETKATKRRRRNEFINFVANIPILQLPSRTTFKLPNQLSKVHGKLKTLLNGRLFKVAEKQEKCTVGKLNKTNTYEESKHKPDRI